MSVQPIPDGYTSITPYLSIKGAAAAIAYYQKVFGATELFRVPMPDGTIGHAELQIGNARIMLAEESPSCGSVSPTTLGGSATGLCLYVEKVDDVFQAAVQAGATVKKPVVDQFYGDRSGSIVDPFGHIWTIATHVEDVDPDEMNRRLEQWTQSQSG